MSPRVLLAFFYLCSGVAGLVYEVSWLRLLGLSLGHTQAATSTVLAAFLGGLAAGAALADGVASTSPRRALRIYAGLELGVALYALTLPALATTLRVPLAIFYGDAGGAAFAVARTLGTLLLVAAPAGAMGATFPVVVRGALGVRPRAPTAGALYTVNTVGGAAGAALAGFALLPAVGFWRTTVIAVCLNLLAAFGGWYLSRIVADGEPSASRPSERRAKKAPRAAERLPDSTPRRHGPLRVLVPLATLISGTLTLGLEVVWTRLLALAIGPTTWAFALMLTIFIGGLALGAALGAWIGSRTRQIASWLEVGLGLSAAALLLAPRALAPLVVHVAELTTRPDMSFGTLMRTQAALLVALLLPQTILLGTIFPLALAHTVGSSLRSDERARVGRLYAVNTLGSIVGALATGFILLPALGPRTSLALFAVVSAIAALAFLASRPSRSRFAWSSALVLALGIMLVRLPQFDPRLLSSGAYKYAAGLSAADLETSLAAGTMLFYRDGAGATVSVRRVGGVTSIAIDGKVDASDGADMLTQKLLAHVPLLLHGSARQVAVVGLGSGVTPGAALRHPIDRLDVIEISPEVIAASRLFDHVSLRPLADPRTRLIVGDGRAHFLFTTQHYDVVISEPSNPWMAGMAALFTREFFAAVRNRLDPGGVMCQWTHTYDMGQADFASIIATFHEVFPHVIVWLVGDGDVLLVGSDTPLDARLAPAAQGWSPAVVRDLASVGVGRPFSLISSIVGNEALAARVGLGAAPQVDDRLALEFSAPRFIVGPESDAVLRALQRDIDAVALPGPVVAARAEATAAEWVDRAQMALKADAFQAASEAATTALRSAPDDLAAVDILVRASAPLQRTNQVRSELTALAARYPLAAAPRIGLSRIATALGDVATGARLAQEAVERAPGWPESWEQLASVFADAGDAEALSETVRSLEARFPSRPAAAFFDGTRRFMQGDWEGAARSAMRAHDLGSDEARTWNLLGAALASQGSTDAARTAFQRARAADQRDMTALLNLASLEQRAGNVAAAHDLYAEALVVDPRSPEALGGLAQTLELQGDWQRAARLRALAQGS